MAKKDARIDRYINDAAPFAQPILKHLRKVVHQGCPEVEETMKWSMPFFMYKGVLCNMAAFKEHCSFGFWKSKLILGKNAKDDGMGHFGRITSLSDLTADRQLLGYIKEAVRLNDTGAKVPGRGKPKEKSPLVIPDYLSAALHQNKKARETFESFSYSHQKEYVEWLAEAKRDETRAKRLETTLAWLREGKPRNWKYQNC
jgi:uncharacterized protein YdeI (YjbR/CyaY-like superfamily)